MSLSVNNHKIWQNHDILLYLCHFMNGKELVLFATSCRLFHKTIVDRPDHWEQQYRRTFCLDDQHEQEWFTWHNWSINTTAEKKEFTFGINQTKQEHSLSSTITTVDDTDKKSILSFDYLPSIPNFGTTQWFYAYHRRQQINCNFMAGRFKKQMCQLPVEKNAELKVVEVNPWNGLVWDRKNSKIWSIYHNLLSKRNGHDNKELAWKELTIPLLPPRFNRTVRINSVNGTHQFVVANVTIITEEEVEDVDTDDSIDKYSIMYPTTTSFIKLKSYKRDTMIVWRHACNPPAKIIDISNTIKSEEREVSHVVGIYNKWMLLSTKHKQDLCHVFDLLDLERNQWVHCSSLPVHKSFISIQSASRKQCQFLTWEIISESVSIEADSTSTTTQSFHTFDNDIQSTRIQWKLFNIQEGQHRCQKILSNQIIIPYHSIIIAGTESYTEDMCLITLWTTYYDQESGIGKLKPLLVVFELDSADQGRVLWSRIMDGITITKIYSKKLIVIKNYDALNVLDVRDGNLLRSLDCLGHLEPTPFLGTLCSLFNWNYNEVWFADMQTGCIYKPPSSLTNQQTEEDNENISLDSIEITALALSLEHINLKHCKYSASCAIISRINTKSGLYTAFML
ncbi:hypothetical protein BDF19DRAFT_430056 [Syncephalis fuscata]|nr:hypothetical protein BDF19DRAFT_430056 [Syncephalis fuscata]